MTRATLLTTAGTTPAGADEPEGAGTVAEVSDRAPAGEATAGPAATDEANLEDDGTELGDDGTVDLEARWEEAASTPWAPPATRRRRTRARLLAGLIALVVLAGAGWGGWTLWQDHQLAGARSSALAAGKADAVLISTYTYQDFAAYSKRIVADSTKEFADNYTKDAGSLGSILAQYKAGSKGTVVGAGLGAGTTTTKATVYVFLNETVSNSKDPSQSERARMVVTLVRPHGRWLIANAIVE